MSQTTNNLGLIKPEITDGGRLTLQNLADNFQKLDDASDINMTAIPTSGFWPRDKKIYYLNVGVGDYIGATNIRAGQAAPKWSSIHIYAIGDKVVPTNDNGHFYTCISPGGSAPSEPTWNTGLQSFTEDKQASQEWEPSKSYNTYDVVVPSADNGRIYVCVTPGTSGTTEPTWATTDGVATVDNEVVWMTYRIVKWQESGTSAHFRNFGKIE